MREHATRANTSTPCGLYREHRQRRASRVTMRSMRTETVRGLEPGARYVFNVVARSVMTGHSVAYERQIFDVPNPDMGVRTPLLAPRPRSFFWDQLVPLSIIASMMAFIYWARPCCKGAGLDSGWRAP